MKAGRQIRSVKEQLKTAGYYSLMIVRNGA